VITARNCDCPSDDWPVIPVIEQRQIKENEMIARALVFSVCLFSIFPVFAQPENWKLIHDKTEAKLRAISSNVHGALGVTALDLTSGERFAINENSVFPQGSAIKIPILMEVYKQANEGKFKLTDMLWVNKAQQVGDSGVLVELGDHTSRLSIRDLGILMIVLSDNTATNMLIDLVGMKNVNNTLASHGLTQTRLQRKMINSAASGRGEENLSTPAEAARLMEILHRGEFLNRQVCDEILTIFASKNSPRWRQAQLTRCSRLA
jgi:beta-lactamase class A